MSHDSWRIEDDLGKAETRFEQAETVLAALEKSHADAAAGGHSPRNGSRHR